ncbi:MAG: serine/threonine phosphatase [Cyanobacteria bacterium RI_101]|nr:serine/threonine phosphatase [Cyanobacteria bacterium RI_101]
MLICPQCNFENPNRNNFCQKCGASLTHHPCPACGADVPFAEPFCPSCGAVAGKLLTVLTRNPALGESFAAEQATLYENCLDIGQRYRLLAPEGQPALQPLGSGLLRGQIVDCQPLQPSILKVLFAQQAEFLSRLPELEPDAIVQDPQWQTLGLPIVALPYLQRRELCPKIPEVYDAWREGDLEVTLLEERQSWPRLDELLAQETVPPLQLAFWLNQLLLLWQALAPHHLAQSLCLPDNIRLDDDQHIALAHLYPDPDPAPKLEDFAQALQTQFAQAPQTAPEELLALLSPLWGDPPAALADVFPQIAHFVQHLEPSEPLDSEAEDFPEFSLEDLEDVEEGALPGELLNTAPESNRVNNSEADDIPTAVLPMQLVSLTDAGYTDRGRNRPHNEDYFGIHTRVETQRNNHGKQVQAQGLYIVCDGMGGHAAGEVASKQAVTTLQTFFRDRWRNQFPAPGTLIEAIAQANDDIYGVNLNNASSGSGRMGTTLVMALVQDTKVMVAHVGDSRIYRITRKGGLEQLTVDHEVGQQAIQNGLDPKIAYSRPDAYQLTQAIGPHDSKFVQPDVRVLDIEEDCLIFLCSDGICDNDLVEENWETYLLPLISSSQDLERGLRKLMEFANEFNGHDNLTGVLVRLKVRPQIPVDVW